MPPVERARPLLGTIVAIRAEAADEPDCLRAIDDAFAEIAHVHARMSFQEAGSDLSAIARLTRGAGCTVDPRTADCLAAAMRFADESGGAFDPVVPGQGACWRDVVLDGTTVAVRRPLRIDLSGIAKGYAVDRACERLRRAGIRSALVGAGGDLRLFGTPEAIALAPRHDAPPAVVRIEDGALASSDVAGSRAEYDAPCHRDGRTGLAVADRFVSVAAPLCRDADALTKVVLAMGDAAAAVLARHGAIAYLHDPETGWRTLGDQA